VKAHLDIDALAVRGFAVDVKEKTVSFSWENLDGRLKLFLVFIFLFALGNSSNAFIILRAMDWAVCAVPVWRGLAFVTSVAMFFVLSGGKRKNDGTAN